MKCKVGQGLEQDAAACGNGGAGQGEQGKRIEHRRNNSTLVALAQLFLPRPAYIWKGYRTWKQDENDPGEADPGRAPIPGLTPRGGR